MTTMPAALLRRLKDLASLAGPVRGGRLPAVLVLILMLGSCAAVSGAADMHVTGNATYRERVAAPPGSRVIVTLSDVSRADAPSVELARQDIALDGRNVPVAFDLAVDPAKIEPRRTYAVRAVLRSADDILLWTTDTVHAVPHDEDDPDLGMLVMVRASRAPEAAGAADTDSRLLGEWIVEDLDGRGVIDNSSTSITFTDDGLVAGRAGCNRYSSEVRAVDGEFATRMVALTRRACTPALGDQEQRFLEVLDGARTYEWDPTGALILKTENGRALRARRH